MIARRVLLVLAVWLLFVEAVCCFGQEPQLDPPAVSRVQVVEANGDRFHNSVIQAAIAAHKRGEIKRLDVIRIRVAMMAPAFRAQVKQLALIQMASSGSDAAPIGSDGKIDEAAVDWEGIAAFLEKLIPLILQLINALS